MSSQWPLLTPSDLNDEAADLRSFAATRRAFQSPMPKVPEDVPQHFLLPAQGDPELWAVRVKVRHTFRTPLLWLTQCSPASRTFSFFRSPAAVSSKIPSKIHPSNQQSPRHLPAPGFRGLFSWKVDHVTSPMPSGAW